VLNERSKCECSRKSIEKKSPSMFYMIETIFNKIPKEFMKEKGVKFNGSRVISENDTK